MTRTSPPRCWKRRTLIRPVVMTWPVRDRGDAADRDEDVAAAGDLDDQPDHARRVVLAVDDDDIAHLAEPVAGGVEDGAPRQACDEDPLRAHAFQRSPEAPGRAREVTRMGG